MAKRMSKAARKKRNTRVVLIVVIVLAVVAFGVRLGRQEVDTRVNADDREEALSTQVNRGSISATVTGSGNLADEGVEDVTIHSSVELDEVLVGVGDRVSPGDLIARVELHTVLSAMTQVQGEINALDEKIRDAAGDEVADTVKTALDARVKKIFCQPGDDVAAVMAEHGALAILSLEGHMEVTIQCTGVSYWDQIYVVTPDGKEHPGRIDSVGQGSAVAIITDNGPAWGAEVQVLDENKALLGTGVLEVHEPLKVTGVAGTIDKIKVEENQKVDQGKILFELTDTSFSANYTGLLEDRKELEEELVELIEVYQTGGIYAKKAGTVTSLGGEDTGNETQTSIQTGNYFSGMGFLGASAFTGPVSQSAGTAEEGEQVILSLCPGERVSVTVHVDETSILSMEVGQEAKISVDALDEQVFPGLVTQVDTTGSGSGGVTAYAVTVELEKQLGMLAGMSATIDIQIDGVENALLVPSDALTMTSAATFVHTSLDPETGALGGMVEVQTGLNNGEFVEIKSGLEEGQTIFYFEKELSFFDMMFGQMGSMGGFGG